MACYEINYDMGLDKLINVINCDSKILRYYLNEYDNRYDLRSISTYGRQ